MSAITPDVSGDVPGGSGVQESRPFNYHSLSAVLRTTGSVVLMASLSVMLVRGWSNGSDLARFYTLLTYCGVLALSGVVLGRVVRENKGARTFLALALGAVSVSVTVLGALSYSLVNDAATGVPTFAAWVAPGPDSVLLAGTTAAVVLSPIAYFGFAVFARRSAQRLTILFLCSNLLLLVLSRLPVVIGSIALALVVVNLYELAAARRRDSALATREGHLAAAIEFLPIAILLGRNFCLYAVDELLLTVSAMIVYVILRQCRYPGHGDTGFRVRLVHLARVPVALAVALGAAATVVAAGAVQATAVPVFTLVLSTLFADLGFSAPAGSALYTRAAAVTLAVGFMLNLCLWPSLAGALMAIVSGAAVVIYGFSAEQKTVFFAGGVALAAGLGHQVHDALREFDFTSWSGLACVGIGAIVVASILERHGPVLRRRIIAWRERFAEWDY